MSLSTVGLTTSFVVQNWVVYVPSSRFTETIPWILQHRGDIDVPMQPNTGCSAEDHQLGFMWSGNKWEPNPKPLRGQWFAFGRVAL